MPTLASASAVGSERDRRASMRALEALEPLSSGTTSIRVGRTALRVSNLEKVMFPRCGVTKLDLLRMYAQLAPAALAHARGRAMTLKRYPDGVDAEPFFQKRCAEGRPPWVPITQPIGDQQVRYCLVEDVRTLLWVANLASIELHVPLASARTPSRPTAVVFDLDPGAGTGIVECSQVALLVHELFATFGLEAHCKTSGSKGVQVYVPLNDPRASFERTTPFARAVAQLLEARHPDLVVSRQSRDLRRGRVLIDWSQNNAHKTTVCAYSIRATERPRVSTPVTWDEVDRTARGTDQEALRFEPAQVLDRLDRHGDMFAPVLRVRQVLPEL